MSLLHLTSSTLCSTGARLPDGLDQEVVHVYAIDSAVLKRVLVYVVAFLAQTNKTR